MLSVADCFHFEKAYFFGVAILTSKRKTKQKTDEAKLLDDATLRLMRAVKEKTAKIGKPLRKQDLLKLGYSERFVAKIEKA